MTFAEASAIKGSPGSWTAEIQEGWDIFGISNGGYLMAVATRAMEAESGGRRLISATGHFLNPTTAGPVAIDVATLKEGRSLSTLRARLSRHDKQLLTVTAVLSDPERPVSSADLTTAEPPDLPPPEDCIPVEPAESAPIPPPLTGKIDLRMAPDDFAAFGEERDGQPISQGWFRLRDGEPMDAHAVVLATDSFPPAIFNSKLPLGWTPTIDLNVQVRNPNPTGWLACRFTTHFVTDGMLEEDGVIWDQEGRLVAISRQFALVSR
ncbi:MAG TPA: thioesterase family protein [Acidimicrobiia bacterium]|jgi:acyl-CoA thioesterase|nr:thioesterase family protein [Acidimicrobiia bacterium]